MIDDIQLRRAEEADSKDLWEWRNHPDVRTHFFNSSIIPWEEHKKWFMKKISDNSSRIYIANFQDRKIGVIRFDKEKNQVSVSVNLNPEFLNKGFGSLLIKKGTDKFINDTRNNKPIIARIKTANTSSIAAFIKARYKLVRKKVQEVVCQFCQKHQ